MAEYVIALAEGRADDEAFAPARAQFSLFCSACHGALAAGNPLLGAPNLTAGVYTYGGDYDSIYQTIANGRQGQMPGFGERLDDTEINLLAAWLYSRSAEAD
jgi:cytochrome c oxidase cbb3-type subunit 3